MKLEILEYNESLRSAWEDFIAVSINGNFLHNRSFFDHNPLNITDDHSFLFLKKNKVAGVIPCTLYEKEDKRILHSHLRSTYGGFIVNEQIGTAEALEMVELLVKKGRELQLNEIIVRNPFRIFHKELCDETDYAMWYHGFKIKSRCLEIAIRLEQDLNEIRSKYINGTKYNIKKAYKFISPCESNDYPAFWNLLERNLMDKHGIKPAHTLDKFLQLVRLVGNEKIKLFAGYFGDKMVCGTLLFLFSSGMHAQYIASDHDYLGYRPLNALLDYLIEWGHNHHYQFFNLGTPNEQEGRVLNDGLCHFKEGFGGRGVLRETMSLIL